jgi:hypothetical protein
VKGSGSTIYVIEKGKKRAIASAGAFEACGYIWAEIVTVSDGALNAVPSGSTLYAPPCPYTRQ